MDNGHENRGLQLGDNYGPLMAVGTVAAIFLAAHCSKSGYVPMWRPSPVVDVPVASISSDGEAVDGGFLAAIPSCVGPVSPTPSITITFRGVLGDSTSLPSPSVSATTITTASSFSSFSIGVRMVALLLVTISSGLFGFLSGLVSMERRARKKAAIPDPQPPVAAATSVVLTVPSSFSGIFSVANIAPNHPIPPPSRLSLWDSRFSPARASSPPTATTTGPAAATNTTMVDETTTTAITTMMKTTTMTATSVAASLPDETIMTMTPSVPTSSSPAPSVADFAVPSAAASAATSPTQGLLFTPDVRPYLTEEEIQAMPDKSARKRERQRNKRHWGAQAAREVKEQES